MNTILNELKPQSVFYFFEQICNIPHGSRNTKAISDFCVSFAKERNLKYIQDDHNNVIIFKQAFSGYEGHDTVILQGHLDMVNEKTPDSNHDFSKDPLDLIIDGDYLHCKDTTLGGDDGIAIAYALAILDDNSIPHPPIEAVFTVDEEIGLLGAEALDTTPLKGKYLINIDSEEEGIFLAGCAGGVTANISFPADYTFINGVSCHLIIKGLLGGHSGMAIDKGRANAHKILGRLLLKLKSNQIYYGIQKINGGTKDNVIPSLCDVILVFPDDDENMNSAMVIIKEFNRELKIEFQVSDPEIEVVLSKNSSYTENIEMLTMKCTEIITFFLVHSPNGIQSMNQSIQGLVETSLNMGIFNTTNDVINFGFSVRSSIKSAKYQLMEQLSYITDFLGGECKFEGEYPAWAYKQESKLRELFTNTYVQMYQKQPEIQTIHAGLECGIFSEKFEKQGKNLDIISFGPDIKNIHTVKEAISISSVERVWDFLLQILKLL